MEQHHVLISTVGVKCTDIHVHVHCLKLTATLLQPLTYTTCNV